MISLFSSNYLSRKPIENCVKLFAKNFSAEKKVLDIGCGNKPYAHLFKCHYTGVDPFPDTQADIMRDAWDTGVPDNSYDGVILNQSLEHISHTKETIAEIFRILKPGGLVLVTVPQTVRNHGMPLSIEESPIPVDPALFDYWIVDYWRFTKYGLALLFQDFKLVKLEESNSYLTTLVQLWNYFLASFGLGILLAPLYLLNNLLGLILDIIFSLVNKIPYPIFRKLDQLVIRGLTLNYILIAKKL